MSLPLVGWGRYSVEHRSHTPFPLVPRICPVYLRDHEVSLLRFENRTLGRRELTPHQVAVGTLRHVDEVEEHVLEPRDRGHQTEAFVRQGPQVDQLAVGIVQDGLERLAGCGGLTLGLETLFDGPEVDQLVRPFSCNNAEGMRDFADIGHGFSLS